MSDLQIMIERIKQLDRDLIPEAIEDSERFLAIATACTPRYDNDGSQHIASSNSRETAMINYAASQVKIDKLQDELADLKLKVEKIMSQIKNDKARRFAKLYYVDLLTQKKIASQSHYSYGTVRNELSSARKMLNIVTPSDTK